MRTNILHMKQIATSVGINVIIFLGAIFSSPEH